MTLLEHCIQGQSDYILPSRDDSLMGLLLGARALHTRCIGGETMTRQQVPSAAAVLLTQCLLVCVKAGCHGNRL